MSERFLGTFCSPDGQAHDISEETPVEVLLDVIESLHTEVVWWRKSYRGAMGLLRVTRGR